MTSPSTNRGFPERLRLARACARSSIGRQKSIPMTSSVGSLRSSPKTRSPVPQQRSRIRACECGASNLIARRRQRSSSFLRSSFDLRDRSAARCERTFRERRHPSAQLRYARRRWGQAPWSRSSSQIRLLPSDAALSREKVRPLQTGSNGFTCMVTGANAMCLDNNAMQWARAWMTHTAPPDAVGFVYTDVGRR